MIEFMGAQVTSQMVGEWLFAYGLNLLASVIILSLGWVAAKTIRRVAVNVMVRARLERILVSFLSNILYALVLAFVVIAALNKLGIQTASLIAIIGAAGLAVGLALQGSLANFAAGVMIIVFRHFKLGDFIQNGTVTGTVVDMNIFTTTLNTPTNEKVIVPNATLTASPLTNFTGNATRRIDLVIGASYEDNIATVRDVLQAIIDGERRILKTPAPFIGIDALAESRVNFVLRVWVLKENLGVVRSDILENIKQRFEEEGITIPYPQQGVHVASLPPQAPVPPPASTPRRKAA